MMNGLIKTNLDEIVEVSMETDLASPDCLRISCILKHGCIDYGDKGKVLYVDCSHSKDCKSDCLYIPAIASFMHTAGIGLVKYRRGQKGQIMDDILDEFDQSELREIKLPIKVNKLEEKTYPQEIKKAFIIFKEKYETELDAETIQKLSNGEFVEKYVLTIRKLGVPEKETIKDKLSKVGKVVTDPVKKGYNSFVHFFKK